MTGKTVNIPILEISEQERAEANLRQKALTRPSVSYARQVWSSLKASYRATG